jgi:hypothetical protein
MAAADSNFHALWMQDLEYAARLDRVFADTIWTEGILGASSFEVTESSPTALTVEVAPGVCIVEGDDQLFQGKYMVRLQTPQSLVIGAAPGSGQRNDLVVIQVRDPNATGAAGDDVVLSVVAGTPSGSPVDPAVPDTALVLARVRVPAATGAITTALIDDLRGSADLEGQPVGTLSLRDGSVTDAKIDSVDASKMTTGTLNAARIPNLDASKITTGTLGDARIPDLAASKITSGTFADARIPSLAASKITSGSFDPARIPNLDTAKITTGTFDDARIPNLNASKITSGAFDPSRIPNLDAAKITTGTLPIARGGTGGTTALGALTNIGGYGKGTGAPAGFRITVSATAPASPGNGDIWIQP